MKQVEWVMEATDVDGSGELTQEELRAELWASVALWYFHVAPTVVNPRHDAAATFPWVYSLAVGAACAGVVSWYSSNWSEVKTLGWLQCIALSL